MYSAVGDNCPVFRFFSGRILVVLFVAMYYCFHIDQETLVADAVSPQPISDMIAESLVVIIAQKFLEKKGFYRGDIDGVLWIKTIQALKSFQKKSGLPVTGKLDKQSLKALGFVLTE